MVRLRKCSTGNWSVVVAWKRHFIIIFHKSVISFHCSGVLLLLYSGNDSLPYFILLLASAPKLIFFPHIYPHNFLKGINESCLLILQSMRFAWTPTESLGEEQKWGLESSNSLFRSPEKHKRSLVPHPQMFSLTHMYTHWKILACVLFPFLVGDKEGGPVGLAAGPTLNMSMG